MTVRLRSVVLPAVVLAGAAALPSSAVATTYQCSLKLPTKVVIDEVEEWQWYVLADNCLDNGVDQATWHLGPRPEASFPVGFTHEQLAIGSYLDLFPMDDTDPKVTWTATPSGAQTADGDPLTQNTASMRVKYGAKLPTVLTRTSTKLSWTGTAIQWSGAAHEYVVRPGLTVGVFHQTGTGAPWTYVKSTTTSSTGKVAVSVTSPQAGNYRLVIPETPTVWAAYSTTIKGRI